MSYDLFFHARRELTIATMKAYFEEQSNFAVSEKQAFYENEATGVYFGFDFVDDREDGRVPVAFNLNYFRPHVFGLEAEPALTAFVREFDLTVDDPQSEGMGTGPYSPAGFLRGWNAGNRFGYRSILSMDEGPTPLTLPSARVESMWRWNFAKARTLDHFEDLIDEAPPCFVPTVMPFQITETEVQTCIVWDLEMAIAIPEIDLVLSPTDDGIKAIAVRDALAMVEVHSTWKPDYEVSDGLCVGMATKLIDTLPAAATKKLRAALRPFKPLARLSPDQVLDAELVAEGRARK